MWLFGVVGIGVFFWFEWFRWNGMLRSCLTEWFSVVLVMCLLDGLCFGFVVLCSDLRLVVLLICGWLFVDGCV